VYLLAEIKIWPSNKIPNGFHKCDGSIFPVAGNEMLYDIIGNKFGGVPGQSFQLPNIDSTTDYDYIICISGNHRV
jgi:microcystin-dependent protein